MRLTASSTTESTISRSAENLAGFLKPDLPPPERTVAYAEGWILGVVWKCILKAIDGLLAKERPEGTGVH